MYIYIYIRGIFSNPVLFGALEKFLHQDWRLIPGGRFPALKYGMA